MLSENDLDHCDGQRLKQIAAARRKCDRRAKAADVLYVRYTDAWMAEQALMHLEEIVKDGLDSAYKGNIGEFLCDWYIDLCHREVRSILDDPRFEPVAAHFQEKYACDLRAELTASLVDE